MAEQSPFVVHTLFDHGAQRVEGLANLVTESDGIERLGHEFESWPMAFRHVNSVPEPRVSAIIGTMNQNCAFELNVLRQRQDRALHVAA